MSPISLWLADYQLLAAALLLGVMLAIAALRQPAQRLAVAKSTLAALAALAILCALPGWSLIHLLSDDAPIAEPAASSTKPTPAFSSTLSTIEPTPDLFHTQPPESPAAVLHTNSRDEVEPASPISWSTYLITAYAAGSAAITLWLIAGALLAHRVRRQATPAPPELQALLQQLCGQEKRAPQLLISPRITAPVALGLRRPTILLPPPSKGWEQPNTVAGGDRAQGGSPRGAMRGGIPDASIPYSSTAPSNLSPSQLLPILAHELAHLQHRDLHTLAATRLLLVLLWPQPLYWLLRRTIRLDQETLADAAAADRAGRLDYAQQLLAWASTASTQRPPRLAGAVGLWEGPSQLKRRIALLLNEQFNVMRSCSRRWRGGSLVAIALLAIGLSTVTFQPQAGVANEAGEVATNVESPATDKGESTTETADIAVAPSDAAVVQDPMVAQLGHRSTDNKTPNVIRGRCLDEANQPIADVEVELYRGKRPNGLQRLVTQTKTNAAGEFEFRDVVDPKQAFPDGIVPPSYIPNTEMFAVIARQPGRVSREVQADDPYTYREGRAFDMLMPPSASLSGIVKDGAGKPIAGARVSKQSANYGNSLIFSAVTDAEGRFSINDLAPFDLEAEKKRQEEEKKATDAQLAAGANAVLSFSMAPRFTVVHPEFASARLPLSSVPGNVDATLSPGARLHGRVIFADGSPAANASVIVKPSVPKQGNGDWGMIDYGKYDVERDYQVTVQTDAEGRFEADSLTPGKVDVWAELPGWLNAGIGEFEVKAGQTASLPDLALTKGGVIRLQLIDDETGRPIAVDQPLTANVSVIMKNKLGRQEAWPEHKKVSDQGVVEIVSLPGTAQVMLQSIEAGAEPQWLPAASDWTAYPQAQVAEGETVDTELRVRKAPTAAAATDATSANEGSTSETTHQSVGMGTWEAVPLEPAKHQPNALELHIVDENKQPLADVEATLYSATSRTGEARPLKTLATDDAGNVVFASVASAEQIAKFEKMKAAGEFIAASPESYLVALKRPGLATALVYQSAGELALAGGKRTIMLRPAVKLNGRVTDPQGKPVAGAIVTAGDWAGTRKIDGVNTTVTDADGRYEFTDRAPFNRAAARNETSTISFAALAANPPASQKDPIAPEDPSVAEVSTLVVTHPDFAVTRIEGGDVPGSTEVQMLPAASIVGRVVHDETGAPAAGVTVRAMSEPTEAPQIKREGDVAYFPVPHTHSATTKTDEQGNYRLANLPAGTYNLWVGVESPLNEPIKLASRGVAGVVAAAGAEPTPAPDSLVGPPPTVTAQLVDAETGRPLQIDGELVAVPMALRADNPRLQAPSHQRIPISKDGTFSFLVLPGKFRLGVEVVEKPGTVYRVHYRSPDDFHNSGSVVDFNFGEDVSIELPVYPMAQLEQLRAEHAKAYQLLEAKKFDEAIAAFSKMIAERPDAHDPLSGRSYANRLAGRYVEAIADAETLLQRFPDNSWSKHLLADLLASSPVEGTRDGKRALQFAEEVIAMAKANHSDSTSVARYLEFVAAAHAELGDYSKAAAVQQEAIAQAAADQKAGMESRLKLYQANKPFRREAPAPATSAPAEKPADQGASNSPPLSPLTALTVASSPVTRATGVVLADAVK